jgi:hypothetical protein
VKTCAGTVPWVPVKVWAGTVPADPVKVSAGTVPCEPVNSSAGTVWVWVAIAEPVKVWAGTVKLEPAAVPPMAVNAPVLDPALLPEVVATDAVEFVPAGVPADVAPVVAVPLVPAGVKLVDELVPAGVNAAVELVPAGVKLELPLLPAGVPAEVAETVPAGVIEAWPPLPPTSKFAAIVPLASFPFKAAISVNPIGQDPETSRITIPEVMCWPESAVYP